MKKRFDLAVLIMAAIIGTNALAAETFTAFERKGYTEEKRTVFTDLEDFAWAEYDIYNLEKTGVINGVGGGRFAPGENVSREQIVKMFSEAADVMEECYGKWYTFSENTEFPEFKDVPQSRWSYTYIKENGWLLPYYPLDDGSFAYEPEEDATRQDIAFAALSLAQKYSDYGSTVDVSMFTDSDDISDPGSVAMAVELGFFKGYEDGSFRPMDGITRAEAAVVLCRVIRYVYSEVSEYEYRGTMLPWNAHEAFRDKTPVFTLSDDKKTISIKGIFTNGGTMLIGWTEDGNNMLQDVEEFQAEVGEEYSIDYKLPSYSGAAVDVSVVYRGEDTLIPGGEVTVMPGKNGEWTLYSHVYEWNKRFAQKKKPMKAAFLSEIDPEVKAMSDEITKGLTSDADKLKAIHDWVCDNIYYDMDNIQFYMYEGGIEAISPKSTLKNRKSVCSGYALFMKALLNAQDIPCFLVYGVTDDFITQDYLVADSNDIIQYYPNHAWNEVKINDEWVYIDATWDTLKRIENGEKKEGMIRYDYFAPTIEKLSYDHAMCYYVNDEGFEYTEEGYDSYFDID